jgi:hypothetical protein
MNVYYTMKVQTSTFGAFIGAGTITGWNCCGGLERYWFRIQILVSEKKNSLAIASGRLHYRVPRLQGGRNVELTPKLTGKYACFPFSFHENYFWKTQQKRCIMRAKALKCSTQNGKEVCLCLSLMP